MNLDIDLSSEELEALFNEIDVDKSNTIDIDELIYFMTKNQEQISPLAASALMNVYFTFIFFIQLNIVDTTHKKIVSRWFQGRLQKYAS